MRRVNSYFKTCCPSRSNWYFWISHSSVFIIVNSSWLKVNFVPLFYGKFCSIWPEKLLFSSLERCESDRTSVPVLCCRIWVSALTPSQPFILIRPFIRARLQSLSFPLSFQGCTREGHGHMVKGHKVKGHEMLHPSPEPTLPHFSY